MTAQKLFKSLEVLIDQGYGELEVYTSNSDSPGENYGAVYFGARIKDDPEGGDRQVVWVE